MTEHFPVRLGDRTFRKAADLAAYMRKRVVGDMLDNPGQTYPADHFMEFEEPEQEAAIQEALLLLAEDTDAEVIRFLLHLGQEREVFARLLERFDGGRPPALPAEIVDSVADSLASRLSVVPVLRERALAALRRLGFQACALRVLLQSGTAQERVSALALVSSSHQLDPFLAGFAAEILAVQNGAEPLLAAAASLFTQPNPVRRAFRDGAIRADPAWADRLDLARALHLDR